ncbi:MAG TPA: sigma-70 family RNA polymerase sigma factor [Bacteroidia bacterium]|nr:sigma-70 family RNA polymerase sigma factor [Bacteroidia bacterium]HNP98971.1 sigma-70 family RNA polymerase sigma factor [Bacteroidia bacterium]
MIKEQDDSIREVIQQNGKKLFDFIRNRVREPEDAEDIFQDVLFELTTSYRLMQPIEKMAAWLYRVARNKITDQYRKKRPDRLEDQFVFRKGDDEDQLFLQDLIRSTSLSPDREFDQAMIWEAIEQAMDELPPEQRDVFIKHELEGISFNEMVEQSGVSLNTLLSRKRYAVLHLRERLQSLYDEIVNS